MVQIFSSRIIQSNFPTDILKSNFVVTSSTSVRTSFSFNYLNFQKPNIFHTIKHDLWIWQYYIYISIYFQHVLYQWGFRSYSMCHVQKTYIFPVYFNTAVQLPNLQPYVLQAIRWLDIWQKQRVDFTEWRSKASDALLLNLRSVVYRSATSQCSNLRYYK